jgi:hypothetical protein
MWPIKFQQSPSIEWKRHGVTRTERYHFREVPLRSDWKALTNKAAVILLQLN